MSSTSNVPGAAAAMAMAMAPESLAWGESPVLYVSYGMVAEKGVRPSLTSAVAAAPSFTVLSPPMGLDYFAVFDGGHHLRAGAAAVERLRVRLAAAISERVSGELISDAPRWFGGPAAPAPAHAVVGWWRTVIKEAFRAVHGEAVASGGEDAAVLGATAFVVALVMEKYTVIASYGDAKAVLCRGGEHVVLTPARDERRAKGAEDEKQKQENAAGQVVAPTFNLANFLQLTLAPGSSSAPVNNNPPPPAVVMPKLNVVAVERKVEDDEFLILANNGLWGVVSPELACAFVRRRLGKTTSRVPIPWVAPVGAAGGSAPPPPPGVLAKELAEMGVYAGSEDNVSVAIVRFKDV